MKKVVPFDANLIPDKAKRVFKGVIFDVYQYEQELYDGSVAIFESVKRPDTIEVFATVGEKILILEDEQPHRNKLIALPGGRTEDTDKSTLDVAKRETLEETGYSFDNWRLIEVKKPIEKGEWFIYTYLASGKYSKVEPKVDAGERIKVLLKSFNEVKKLQESGEVRLGQSVLKEANSLKDLMSMPEFKGKVVDR